MPSLRGGLFHQEYRQNHFPTSNIYFCLSELPEFLSLVSKKYLKNQRIAQLLYKLINLKAKALTNKNKCKNYIYIYISSLIYIYIKLR